MVNGTMRSWVSPSARTAGPGEDEAQQARAADAVRQPASDGPEPAWRAPRTPPRAGPRRCGREAEDLLQQLRQADGERHEAAEGDEVVQGEQPRHRLAQPGEHLAERLGRGPALRVAREQQEHDAPERAPPARTAGRWTEARCRWPASARRTAPRSGRCCPPRRCPARAPAAPAGTSRTRRRCRPRTTCPPCRAAGPRARGRERVPACPSMKAGMTAMPSSRPPNTMRPPNRSVSMPIGRRTTEPSRTGIATSSHVCCSVRPSVVWKVLAIGARMPHSAKEMANAMVARTRAVVRAAVRQWSAIVLRSSGVSLASSASRARRRFRSVQVGGEAGRREREERDGLVTVRGPARPPTPRKRPICTNSRASTAARMRFCAAARRRAVALENDCFIRPRSLPR